MYNKAINIYRYQISGSQRIENFYWFFLIFFGSFFFFLQSFNSYLNTNNFHLENLNNSSISFFPQGLVMGFYSLLGLLFSFYSFFSILFKIGSGFNEFNKKENIIRIFRWGFPGINRRIQICYSLDDVKSIKLFTSSGKTICLSLKGDLDIVLVRKDFFDSVEFLEQQAIDIANFLDLPLLYV